MFDVTTVGADSAIVTSSSGLKITLDEIQSDQNLNSFIAKYQSSAPVLDFSSIPGASVAATVELAREADLNSVVGFYRVLDSSGSVRDPLTGLSVSPGDASYAEKALLSNNLVTELAGLTVADDQTSSTPYTIEETSIIAPYAVVNETDTYFAFGAANSDGYDHFKSLGLNTFGLEDLNGGGDKDNDDMIIRFDFV